MSSSRKILYLGAPTGTSQHRISALRRVGHSVFVANPDEFVTGPFFLRKLNFEMGSLLLESRVRRNLLASLAEKRFDCVWVDQGRNVGPKLIAELKGRYGPTAVHNLDDPFGKRDRAMWLLFKKAVAHYDLVVVPRRDNVADAQKLGARKVEFHFRTADEVAHAPRSLTESEIEKWKSEVIFVGTAIVGERRDEFVAALLREKIPIQIVGDRWDRSRHWPEIKSVWKGPGTKTDLDYSGAILGSRIPLCLLSRLNRDLHTTRSLEIPSMGALLLAPRTSDHEELYMDGSEAVMWEDINECVEKCRFLLSNESIRAEIARNGHERCLKNNLFNEPFVKLALRKLFDDPDL